MQNKEFIVSGVPEKFKLWVSKKTALYLIGADCMDKGINVDELSKKRKESKQEHYDFELCDRTLMLLDHFLVKSKDSNTSVRKILNSFTQQERKAFIMYVSNKFTLKELCKFYGFSPSSFTEICIEFFTKLDNELNPVGEGRELCLMPQKKTR